MQLYAESCESNQSLNLRLVLWAPNTEGVTWKSDNDSWDLEQCGINQDSWALEEEKQWCGTLQ